MHVQDVEIERELNSYARLVNEALEEIFPRSPDENYYRSVAGLTYGVVDVHSLNEAVAKPAWDLLDRGGKRWRPALGMIVYEAFGGRAEDIVKLLTIPELIHNGTLIVDDVEDGSDVRRGKPCIHRIYGEDIAINAGNTLYYLPVAAVLSRSRLPGEIQSALLKIYVEEMLRLSMGQALDIAWHRGIGGDISEEEYLLMCDLKTGSLARMSVRIACLVAGARGVVEEKFSRFASSIAVAFQIQDDILNLVGEESLYGKEIGGDLREGKRTLMVIHALRTLPRNEGEKLRGVLGMKTADRRKISEVIELIKASGAIEYSKSVARHLVEEGWSAVEPELRPGRAKELLYSLAEYLIMRSK
ncbi:MAG: polyprenyl synthetase family protein [Nitrososphaerota archaeon]